MSMRISRLILIGATIILLAVMLAACLAVAPSQALPPTPTLPAPTPTLFALSPTATRTGQPQSITGLAILGDSTQDEYRADDARGGEYGPTTRSWVELLAELRAINLGTWGAWPEPRRGGYAYNWARSGATSAQMLDAGQAAGAAAQVRAGQVSHAVIQIGINDFYFGGLGLAIYNGEEEGAILEGRLNYIADNIISAAQTLKQSGPCVVIIAATQDYLSLPVVPELYTAYQDPAGRQRFVDAVAYLNRRLARRSAEVGVHFFDFNAAYLAAIQAHLDHEGWLVVGGERIDLRIRGNGPRFGLLDDAYIHPGTVLSGLYANVYLTAFNQFFGTSFTPLSDDEILQAAGLR